MAKTTVGVAGLGIMGSAISANLAAAGITTLGYDIVAKRRKAAEAAGVTAAKDIRDLARNAPIVLTSLPSTESLLAVAREIAQAQGIAKIVIAK